MFNPDPKPLPKEKKVQQPLKRSPLKRSKEYKVSRVSDTEKKRQAKYLKLMREYMLKNPICEVKGCGSYSETNHHRAGRIGDNLFKHFFACCFYHHREIEENPVWAKENGYSLNRVKNN